MSINAKIIEHLYYFDMSYYDDTFVEEKLWFSSSVTIHML